MTVAAWSIAREASRSADLTGPIRFARRLKEIARRHRARTAEITVAATGHPGVMADFRRAVGRN
jgi:hypothetical protein